MELKYSIGDIVGLGKTYYNGATAIIIGINMAQSPNLHDGGWTTFDYVILTDRNELLHISDVCIDQLISRIQVSGSL